MAELSGTRSNQGSFSVQVDDTKESQRTLAADISGPTNRSRWIYFECCCIQVNGHVVTFGLLYPVRGRTRLDIPNILDISNMLRGGGGLGEASCIGGATPRIVKAV
ncbi:uncharacterized protein [Cardiocondyla obscurior]|uniref:uncharacterized protein n=1 Tax=Cardiocondyla obscurior TaxID=286306 RepID=UPI003965899F